MDAELIRSAAGEKIPCSLLPVTRKYFDIKAAKYLAESCQSQNIKSLIINSSADLALSAISKTWYYKNLNIIFQLNMQFSHYKRDIWHTWLYSKVDTFITPLKKISDDLQKYTKISNSRIQVIHYGIELKKFQSIQNAAKKCRKELQLPINAFIVGVTGRLDPLKGQEYLIRAAALLAQRKIPIHVLLVGEPTRNHSENYAPYLANLAKELHVSSIVHFRPFMKDIEIAYGAMDCFALTSHCETYGMVTIEAMSSGLPVIGTNTGGTPGLIDDAITGWLVPFANEQKLAEKIELLYREKKLRLKMGKAASQKAKSDFSHEKQIEQLTKLIK